MITVIVDCNNDKILIEETGIEMKVTHPNKYLPVLVEIFTAIDATGVALVKIDEDTRTTVAEW